MSIRRKYIVSVSILFLGAFCAWQVLSFFNVPAFDPKAPNVGELRGAFNANKNTFERIKDMVLEDFPVEIQITQHTRSVVGLQKSRVQKYKSLLSSISMNANLATSNDRLIQFVCEQSEFSMAVDRHWANGIMYAASDAKNYGVIVEDLRDVHLNQESLYLLPLEEHWFMFHREY